MITAKDCMDGKDVLGDFVKGEGPQADKQTVRCIYARNTTQSLSDRLTMERYQRQADEKLSRDMRIASGELKLDEFGREIKPPVKPNFRLINAGRDVLKEALDRSQQARSNYPERSNS